ncbi:hypothetical protein, partial [Salmonella enterica]|uniref:hypothetical protein n=1 Tax=Salmonella enterica TaxID=28901 RepID=UPI0032991432
MRTKGRLERMGRRSARGINNGVINHDMVTRRGLRAWRDGRPALQAGEEYSDDCSYSWGAGDEPQPRYRFAAAD